MFQQHSRPLHMTPSQSTHDAVSENPVCFQTFNCDIISRAGTCYILALRSGTLGYLLDRLVVWWRQVLDTTLRSVGMDFRIEWTVGTDLGATNTT